MVAAAGNTLVRRFLVLDLTYYPPEDWWSRPESSQGRYSDLVVPQSEDRSRPPFLWTTSVTCK